MSPWRRTNKQPESENRASQQIDKGLLTFAMLRKHIFGHTTSTSVWIGVPSPNPLRKTLLKHLMITSEIHYCKYLPVQCSSSRGKLLYIHLMMMMMMIYWCHH